MLGELGQEIERLEDLKVWRHSRLRSVSFWFGEGPASRLLDLIDDSARVAELDQMRTRINH